ILVARFKSDFARASARRLAEAFGGEVIDADEGLPASIRKVKREPRLFVTAYDAFRWWRRSNVTAQWLGYTFRLDRTPCDLVRVLSAAPRFLALERIPGEAEHAQAHWKALGEEGLSPSLFEFWRQLVVEQPFHVYNWEDFHSLWEAEPLQSARGE
ncbi:MAG: hypothetical protein SNJ52_05625, partial [Verrucomicrobiia bacterium]